MFAPPPATVLAEPLAVLLPPPPTVPPPPGGAIGVTTADEAIFASSDVVGAPRDRAQASHCQIALAAAHDRKRLQIQISIIHASHIAVAAADGSVVVGDLIRRLAAEIRVAVAGGHAAAGNGRAAYAGRHAVDARSRDRIRGDRQTARQDAGGLDAQALHVGRAQHQRLRVGGAEEVGRGVAAGIPRSAPAGADQGGADCLAASREAGVGAAARVAYGDFEPGFALLRERRIEAQFEAAVLDFDARKLDRRHQAGC
ncbi:MAG: hypothetical protein IPG63_00245 [Xanthomonadales bacterium]|nr:hypothetical protein [Xanthomonadales bacterium]